MVLRDDLVAYLDDYLHTRDIPDYGPMGLQVEGREEVNKIITGVSAHKELFKRAVAQNADLILVHHGLLWDRDSRVIKGLFKRRLQFLFEHDVTLLAYHLALDRHEEVGNNVLAAQALKLQQCQPLGEIGIQGCCEAVTIERLSELVTSLFHHPLVTFPHGPDRIRTVGICSGGAARDLFLAIEAKLDVYITGEAAEPTMQVAQEAGIHFIAAGHHATEKLGVRALGEHIAKRFKLEVEFLDVDNPV